MRYKYVKTLNNLLVEINYRTENLSTFHAWRGQSNTKWEPFPGIYRRLQNNGYDKTEINEGLVREYEDDLFCEANGLGYYGEVGGNRLDLMVNLQHHGGATRLLDVTLNPLIALWFASPIPKNDAEGCADVNGCILRYDINSAYHAFPEEVFTWNDIVEKELNGKLCGKPVLYSPRRSNERIKAQSSAFLLTELKSTLADGSIFTEESEYISITKIDFPGTLKKDIRTYLRSSCGLREYEVFPDFEGFAHAHATSIQFPRIHDKLFRSGDSSGMSPTPFNPDQ